MAIAHTSSSSTYAALNLALLRKTWQSVCKTMDFILTMSGQSAARSWSSRLRARIKAEMDRFCDAMLLIRREIEDIVSGAVEVSESPLKGALILLLWSLQKHGTSPTAAKLLLSPLPG